MIKIRVHFGLIGLLASYRLICFHGGGAKVTQQNGIIQYPWFENSLHGKHEAEGQRVQGETKTAGFTSLFESFSRNRNCCCRSHNTAAVLVQRKTAEHCSRGRHVTEEKKTCSSGSSQRRTSSFLFVASNIYSQGNNDGRPENPRKTKLHAVDQSAPLLLGFPSLLMATSPRNQQ